MVFSGEIAFAPLDQLKIGTIHCGARALWHLFFLLLLNGLFVRLFFKELQLTIFDPITARLFGYNEKFIHYALMALTSITTVIAFDVVGAVVVVSLMIVPAATALLISTSLHQMLRTGILCAIGTGFFGTIVALYTDISIAGSIATTAGGLFFITFVKTTFLK
jgi:manganese/zinc/iron transport system permease protein